MTAVTLVVCGPNRGGGRSISGKDRAFLSSPSRGLPIRNALNVAVAITAVRADTIRFGKYTSSDVWLIEPCAGDVTRIRAKLWQVSPSELIDARHIRAPKGQRRAPFLSSNGQHNSVRLARTHSQSGNVHDRAERERH